MNARHLAVCALAGAVLAACSSNTKVATNNASPGRQTMTNPAALIAAAPGATSALKTARELTTVTSTMSGMGTFFSTNGAVDFATGQAEVTTTIGGMTEQTIVDGGTIYSSLPAGMAIPGAKPWLKITSSDLGQLGQGLGAGSALGSLLPSGNSNPANGLDILAGVSGTVTTVGTEQIGGVPTTHYRFTADLSKAMQSVPPADQASLRQLESALGAGTPTVDVWLDGSGVARQIAFVHWKPSRPPVASSGLPKPASPEP